MNVFQTHKQIVQNYRTYIESFLRIKDERIRAEVKKALQNGFLFPEPLVQFNPAYEKGASMEELCNSGVLHSQMRDIFRGYELYRHQVEAIRLGVKNKDFIVTSGTGSGKSLTYIATIFNEILRQPGGKKGIKAIIVYPMNALINSQTEEFRKYQGKYEEKHGQSSFPISFHQYTGQEKDNIRERIKTDPPDILLTNYMMLELIMTRSRESSLREAIEGSLKYLVFDELHTYRGRQGADVAMLIRRIKHFAKKPDLICIGTSATMVSGDSLVDQKAAVGEVGALIFGKTFAPEQVINEYLVRQTAFSGHLPSREALHHAVLTPVDIQAPESALGSHPLAVWMENAVALEEVDGWLRRKKPSTLKEIVESLAQASGAPADLCAKAVQDTLRWAQQVNSTLAEERRTYLPYRIHQFISQTGSVYVTLEKPEERAIELKPGRYIKGADQSLKKLFPVVFSRVSGHEFICVRKKLDDSTLEPRDFTDTFTDEDAEGEDLGYLIIPHDEKEVWTEEDKSLLPDSWIEETQAGIRVITKYRHRIPSQIFFNKEGYFSNEPAPDKPIMGWYMPVKLLFDPTSGTFYDPKTNEGTKLMRLGNEGRSTATTIISFEVVRGLALAGLDPSEQKLLSFTDNRQDAALQSGHFNDFIKVGQVRSAIYHALEKAPGHQLDFASLPQAIFDALNLRQEEYAQAPSDFPGPRQENENAVKEYLMIRSLYDLRRSWRVVLPNLEQCGLLNIRYKYLDQTVAKDDYWQNIPILNACNSEDRYRIVEDVLDYFRTSYAIEYSELSHNRIGEVQRRIAQKLKAPWTLDMDERLEVPAYVRVKTLNSFSKTHFTVSAGLLSSLGQYFKYENKKLEDKASLKKEDYEQFIEQLFDLLERAGYLKGEAISNGTNGPIRIYRLRVDTISWEMGDFKTAKVDNVRFRSYLEKQPPKPNAFFQDFYRQNFKDLKPIEGKEHTGQVKTEDRIEREDKFRKGLISALFCSPTMELGIDIANLNVVHMRNVPPNPANYAQRSGRAGRSGQGALVFTYCSNFAPHDRHYFKHSKDMVAGSVMPPRIDLSNPELLITHINALYLSEWGTFDIEKSIADLVDETHPDLPLKEKIRESLRLGHESRCKTVLAAIRKIIGDFRKELENSTYWYNEDWLISQVDQAPAKLDRSLDRWRSLYQNANRRLLEAQEIVRNHVYSADHEKVKEAQRVERRSKRQISLLKNENLKAGSLSEFYPFRYFASEGFLPGYNFTKLPLRAYIGENGYDNYGEYISRPRFIALREFGPRNIIYHNGEKYEVERMEVTEAEKELIKAKVSDVSGYFFVDKEYELEFCPVTQTRVSNQGIIANLLQMSEVVTRPRERISCEEEERLSTGFEIETFFSVPQGMHATTRLDVRSQEDVLLKIFFIPATKLVQVNRKWRRSKDDGFAMGLKTGFWKRKAESEQQQQTPDGEVIKNVHLFTENWADALYIQPVKALGLDENGIYTLQYAIKRAIELLYQVEPNEISVIAMGKTETPNILVYESAEGSLGILNQLVMRHDEFMRIIEKAYEICYFKDGVDTRPDLGPATYDDLLSYYNQRYHDKIDRQSVKAALETLMACKVELMKPARYENYEEQYLQLVQEADPNSSTEKTFLDFLHRKGIRLPDRAQVEMLKSHNLYVMPDFFYEPNIYVFCDGTPHDDPKVRERDQLQRRAMRDSGLRVITWYYRDSLEELVDRYRDVFIKVK